MEPSPLAREKLTKIGELSLEEKQKVKYSGDLTALLADYFTDRISADELWRRLRKFKEEGREFMVKETQLRLLNAVSLGSSKTDFERCRNGILGLETLKEPNRYAELELGMKSVEGLRQQYQRKREKAFDSIKADIQKQVEVAARQVAKQAGNRKLSVDVESSVEAGVKTSPKWRDFLIEHEKTFGQKFDDWLTGMKGLI